MQESPRLTLVEEYVLCVFGAGRTIPVYSTKVSSGVVATAIYDLEVAGVITIDAKNHVYTASNLPKQLSFLQLVYNHVEEHQGIQARNLALWFVALTAGKQLGALVDAIGTELEAKGLAQLTDKPLFALHQQINPDVNTLDQIIARMQQELTGDTNASTQTLALATALAAAGLLRQYFSNLHEQHLHQQLKAFAHTPEGKRIKRVERYVNDVAWIIFWLSP